MTKSQKIEELLEVIGSKPMNEALEENIMYDLLTERDNGLTIAERYNTTPNKVSEVKRKMKLLVWTSNVDNTVNTTFSDRLDALHHMVKDVNVEGDVTYIAPSVKEQYAEYRLMQGDSINKICNDIKLKRSIVESIKSELDNTVYLETPLCVNLEQVIEQEVEPDVAGGSEMITGFLKRMEGLSWYEQLREFRSFFEYYCYINESWLSRISNIYSTNYSMYGINVTACKDVYVNAGCLNVGHCVDLANKVIHAYDSMFDEFRTVNTPLLERAIKEMIDMEEK